MFVPNAAQAVIADPKITDYLLKKPGKAKFFVGFGVYPGAMAGVTRRLVTPCRYT